MNPIDIIAKFYNKDTKAFRILVEHGRQVAVKALEAAKQVPGLNPDLGFIERAAMLHDIGIFQTAAPELGCHGPHPYICHGVLGRALLEKIGLPDDALVCERHVGVGLSAGDIRREGLPLPERDMLPVSVEEQIICYADKFFSKNGDADGREKTVEKITRSLEPYGPDKVQRFRAWVELFGRAHRTKG
ncbi:MAG: phosphohydrolase [Desulfobacterales bacterium]|nr:MAG: phosphohydrolase [Desulfobacterales bacterium]